MIVALIVGILAAAWFGHWAWGAAIGGLLYLGSCMSNPEADCLWCGGNAKRRSEGGKVFHRCYVCGGSGSRRRVGTVGLQTLGVMRRPK